MPLASSVGWAETFLSSFSNFVLVFNVSIIVYFVTFCAASAATWRTIMTKAALLALPARLSVSPSVPAWAHSSKPAAACVLLWAHAGTGHIDRLLQHWRAAGEYGQCHIISVRRLVNTDFQTM